MTANKSNYWVWADVPDQKLSELIVQELVNTTKSLTSYENEFADKGYDIDVLYEEIDENIFLCEICNFWTYNDEKDELDGIYICCRECFINNED